ncbi:hypothetical protein BDW74DRAFT_177855 [Aspergillus multicolor]|uniref:NAD(P)/FAD-dependent oxidoreductase n=1 Tax=Aspergillus multicolor TaxID=41759 RepID=UPI003CCDC889
MVSETFEFYARALGAMSSLGIARAGQKLQSIPHNFTYQATANPKNVVIIGGSYAGTKLAQRLTETLPTGYRAVLIERNSHFNHFFVFPRFGVTKGKEDKAFIPYDNFAKDAPRGIFEHIRDTATEITPRTVKLQSGVELEYEYLTVATGSWQPAPSKYDVITKEEGVDAFRATQRAVAAAKSIAVIGGGAVGVQMAGDIKSYYPAKDITLVHSRDKVLSAFGPRLQDVAMDTLKKMGVDAVTGERPTIKHDSKVEGSAVGPGSLTFKDGSEKRYDLLLPCTGQRPNSSILARLLPGAIDAQTRQILVRPTLQVDDASSSENTHTNTETANRIFSLGDVAKTGGPRFARAARAQAEIVTSNILALIHGQKLDEYQPAMYEGAIKLTLGKDDFVFNARLPDGRELMKFGKADSRHDDSHLAQAWEDLGAKMDGGYTHAADTGKERMEKHQEKFNSTWGEPWEKHREHQVPFGRKEA